MNTATSNPVKILQFGEGNFLRAFIDWMVQGMNDRADFRGSVELAKTIPGPFAPAFEAQDYEYNLVVRGLDQGEVIDSRYPISCIAGAVNAYEDFDGYLGAAANPDLRVVVSNTTEAGIAYHEAEQATDRPAHSFPGKLTQFLHERYRIFAGDPTAGLLMMPCELIEKNGQTLKAYVLKHAERWYQDPKFTTWLNEACVFYDTLVDRIVPGHDAKERAKVKEACCIDDELLVVTEPYHVFVIQGPEREDVLPFKKAGFNVIWTDDLTPYRTLKVRILNGGHTFLAMVGMSLGLTTVRDCLEDPLLGAALKAFYAADVFPLMGFGADELAAYRDKILDRFANPFVDHKLEAIALNSVAKFISRILPGVRDYVAKFNAAPELASFALAALINRYLHTAGVMDDEPIVAAFSDIGLTYGDRSEAAVGAVFATPTIWIQGAVIPPVVQSRVAELYAGIRRYGAAATLKGLLSERKDHECLETSHCIA